MQLKYRKWINVVKYKSDIGFKLLYLKLVQMKLILMLNVAEMHKWYILMTAIVTDILFNESLYCY